MKKTILLSILCLSLVLFAGCTKKSGNEKNNGTDGTVSNQSDISSQNGTASGSQEIINPTPGDDNVFDCNEIPELEENDSTNKSDSSASSSNSSQPSNLSSSSSTVSDKSNQQSESNSSSTSTSNNTDTEPGFSHGWR